MLAITSAPFLTFPHTRTHTQYRFNNIFMYELVIRLTNKYGKLKGFIFALRNLSIFELPTEKPNPKRYNTNREKKSDYDKRLIHKCVVAKKSIINAHSKTFTQWIQAVYYTTKYDLAWKRKLLDRWTISYFIIYFYSLHGIFFSLSFPYSSHYHIIYVNVWWIILNWNDDRRPNSAAHRQAIIRFQDILHISLEWYVRCTQRIELQLQIIQ